MESIQEWIQVCNRMRPLKLSTEPFLDDTIGYMSFRLLRE